MKIIGKTIIPLFLTIVMLASCNGFPPIPKTQPTQAMETALAIVGTAIAETQTAIPTATSTATMLPSATPLPTFSPLPPTETPKPIKTSIPISGTPTEVSIENGLTWTECVVPYFNFPHESEDREFATSCLNIKWLGFDNYNIEVNGQRLREVRLRGEIGDNLWLAIGKDVYQTRYTRSNAHDYELLKNGIVIARASAYLVTFDPNIKLWNIAGKSVWEIYSEPPSIIVDGINLTEKNQLEGAFFPYDIKNKLMYIAKKDGKYHIVYDEQVIGPEFDAIFMSHCCASTTVLYGHEQYWFWGRREGTYYVVAIH